MPPPQQQKALLYIYIFEERSPESRREVTIEQNVDRIYTNMQIKHEDLYFTEGENSIKIETNAADIVVWNPWIEKAKGKKKTIVIFVHTSKTSPS